MRRLLFALMVGLGLLGQMALSHTVTNAPEGAWRYSYKGQLSGSTTWYASNTNELAGLASGGYVTYETPGWFHGSSGLHFRTYETWILSETNVTVSFGSGGDDGHSVFVDGVFAAGAGYGVNVYVDLDLQAGVPRHLLLTSNNALGSWHVNCKGRIGDVGDNVPLEDIPGIRIHADGDFEGWTSCPNGALALDGDGDLVRIPDSAELRFGDESFTLSLWVKLEHLHEKMVLLSCYKVEREYIGIKFDPDEGTNFIFNCRDSNNVYLRTQAPPVAGQWVHLAGVRDAATARLVFYVNGEVADETTDTRTGDFTPSLPADWGIGSVPHPGSPNFALTDGSVDDVRIWRRALTAEEIRASMRERLTGAETDLAGYWNFDDGTADDSTANGNHGVLVDDAEVICREDGQPFAGSTTAFLVADSGSLTDTEREFLALVEVGGTVDVLDAATVKSGVDLAQYNAFCCFGYGSSSMTNVFDQDFCDHIYAAVEAGATLVINSQAQGTSLYIVGGYGGGSEKSWTPSYPDTRFVSSIVDDEPLLDGVVPYAGDPNAHTIWYWHSVESESMMWRVENQRTYTRFQRDPHIIEPDGYLTEGFTASTTVYGGERTPFWLRGQGRVVLFGTLHWTFDQATGDGGTIGPAGQQILANIATLPRFGDTRGPVAHYPFNGDAQDESGYGNHGTVNGAVLTEDRHGEAGKAYWFDGVDDHIRLPSIIERYDVATLVAWVKTAGEVAYGQGVVSKPRRPNGSGLRINANASSVGLSFSRELSGPDLHAGVTVRDVASNEWHMLVGVINEDELTLYLDGVAVSNDTFAAGVATSTEDMVIGRELHQDANEYGKRYFQGAIDEVRVYDRALSGDEVAELYAAEVPDPADYDGEVSDVVAVGWDQRVGLRWVAPSDSAGVRVQMTTGGAPSGPNDGVTVFDGSRSTTVVTGLVDDVVYDFGLFAYDASGTFGTGVFVQAMPFNKTRPMLEWEPVDVATWYGVRMRGRGGRNLDQWLEQSVPRWRVDRDLLPGRHMVQVRGYVPVSGPTRWARPRHIEVSGRIPVEPPMVYAPRGEVDASRPVFLWDWVEDAVWYEIQMHLGHRTWAVVWVQDVLSLVPATDSPISQGKWRIRACGLDGRGRWSEWVRFAFSGGEASTPVSGEIDDSYLHIETSRGEDLGLGPRLSTVTPDGQSGEVLVTWASEPGATYTIYGSTNLVDGEWFAVETMVGDGTELEFLHDGGAERIMFYRLGVE